MFPLKTAVLVAALAVVAQGPLRAEELFHVDFSKGSPGEDVPIEENSLPQTFPSALVTSLVKSNGLTFRLAKDGALPGPYALYTDESTKANGSFVFRWGDDAEGLRVTSGVLTISWKMNFVSGSDTDISFQVLRPDLPKESGRMARISISAAGQVKMGGSKETGADNDSKIAKGFTLNAPHTMVWTLDFATGVQELKVDGGAIEYSSTKMPTLNFYPKAAAVAFKVDVRGNDGTLAIGDVVINSSDPATKP